MNYKPDKTIIIINPYSHQGRGWKRWLSVKSKIYQRLPGNTTEVIIEKGTSFSDLLSSRFLSPTLVIAAGGDGTVHYLVN